MYTLHAFMCVIIMVYYVSEIEASSFAHKHKHYTRKSSPKAYPSMCNDDNVIDEKQQPHNEQQKKNQQQHALRIQKCPFGCHSFSVFCWFRLLCYLTTMTAPIIIIIQFIIIFRDFISADYMSCSSSDTTMYI